MSVQLVSYFVIVEKGVDGRNISSHCRSGKLSYGSTYLYVFDHIFKKFWPFVVWRVLFCFLASCVKCDGPVTGNGSLGGGRRQHIYQGLQCRTVLEDISDDDQEDGDTVDEVNFSSLF